MYIPPTTFGTLVSTLGEYLCPTKRNATPTQQVAQEDRKPHQESKEREEKLTKRINEIRDSVMKSVKAAPATNSDLLNELHQEPINLNKLNIYVLSDKDFKLDEYFNPIDRTPPKSITLDVDNGFDIGDPAKLCNLINGIKDGSHVTSLHYSSGYVQSTTGHEEVIKALKAKFPNITKASIAYMGGNELHELFAKAFKNPN